jgi:capsular polysaccharide transport system ATP-binding protein
MNPAIQIDHVGRRFKQGRSWVYALQDFSISIQRGDRIGILGLGDSGKTTALRVISGCETVQKGTVSRGLTTSWTIPTRNFLSAQLTVVANLRFIARMYGLDEQDYVHRVMDLGDISELRNTKLHALSRIALAQLVFAMGICHEVDVYLFDDKFSEGTPRFRERVSNWLRSLGNERSVVIATSQAPLVLEFCSQAYVLEEGRSTYYPNIADAAAFHEEASRRAAKREAELARVAAVIE